MSKPVCLPEYFVIIWTLQLTWCYIPTIRWLLVYFTFRAANHYILAVVLYRKVSVHCTINTERQACEVQHLLLQFLGTFCRPWWNVQRWTTRQLEVSHQQRKSDRKYAEEFPLIFMGCEMPSSQHLDVIQAEMLFTNCFVVHNITLSPADHDICSGARFHKSELQRTIYIYIRYTQNLITML